MRTHETFQAHCQYCFRVFEKATLEDAIRAVQEHEEKRKEGQCEES